KMHDSAAKVGAHIDGIFFCPHGPEDNCECRKPKNGLFKEIKSRMGTRLEGVPVVGDSLRDLQAGVSMGCRPFLVRTGKGKKTEKDQGSDLPDGTLVFDDLMAVAEHLVPDDPFAERK
ncbi:MAG: HAD-IIIA family hydrolase, partial [Limnobacter sp.]|nr:HAD-IIIA family hydrolase [Limnobacter sp.]